MSDTVKLIIEMPKAMYECIQNKTYCGSLYEYLEKGIPLDDVKAEIIQSCCMPYNNYDQGRNYGLYMATQILDNIGKTESEDA
jgi:hypothetical protein